MGSKPTPASCTVRRTRSLFVPFGSDHQLPRTIVDGAHRIRGVQKQVQDDLLKLDTIARDRRKIVGKFRPQNHPVSLKFTQRQAQSPLVSASFRSTDSVVALFLAKSARNRVITSDARLPSRIVRRAVSRAPSTFGGIGGQHPQTGAGVGDDARQRLVDFVRDRRRQCAEARDPGHVCELRSGLAERLFRKPALRHILNRADVLQSTILVSGCRERPSAGT